MSDADPLAAAREALRERQGEGARYDAATAPAEALRWARLGTAYFARLLNDISDAALGAPSLVPGWSRGHVVAAVGYQARALTRLTEWAAGGEARPMHRAEAERLAEIDFGATLPARALRGLFHHAAVHLDVEWRDLPEGAWERPLPLSEGGVVTARDTAWLRAREVWLRAVDLDAGGSFLDMPPAVVDGLLEETAERWAGPPVTLEPTAGPPIALAGGGPAVAGAAADLARWVSGRGVRRLTHAAPLPEVPMVR